MTRYSISLNTTSEKTVPRQTLFLGYHNPLGPYLNCREIWWDTCAESRDVSETSALPWLSSPASERTASNKGRVLWKAQKSLTWDRALPPRLIVATILPSTQRERSSFKELNSDQFCFTKHKQNKSVWYSPFQMSGVSHTGS